MVDSLNIGLSMTTEFDPPAYCVSTTGFPPGYFVVRNIGTGKLLDVEQDGRYDGIPFRIYCQLRIYIDQCLPGAEVILFTEKESSHVLSERCYHAISTTIHVSVGLRDVATDNQANTCFMQ